jgi:hypothetical protein
VDLALASTWTRRSWSGTGPVSSRTPWYGWNEAIYPRDLAEGTPIVTDRQVPGGICATPAQASHAPAAVARRTLGARLATDDEMKKLKLAKGRACWRPIRSSRTGGGAAAHRHQPGSRPVRRPGAGFVTLRQRGYLSD